MLEYLKDWRIWLICVVIVIIVENPIAGWCFEKPKSIDWIIYADGVLQMANELEDPDRKVGPSLWHEYDRDPYHKSNFKKSKPNFGFKGFCFKWTKLNAVQSRYNFSRYWDIRLDTKVNPKKLVPEHLVQTVIGTAKRFEFAAGTEIGEGWQLTPVAGFTVKW